MVPEHAKPEPQQKRHRGEGHLWAGLVLVSTALGLLPGRAAQIAASIEYDFVARPTGLSPDFDQSEGISLRFLAIKAIDGFQVDAALWQPSGKQSADTTLIGMVH